MEMRNALLNIYLRTINTHAINLPNEDAAKVCIDTKPIVKKSKEEPNYGRSAENSDSKFQRSLIQDAKQLSSMVVRK